MDARIGEICPERLYTTAEVTQRTGLGDKALRLARQRADDPLRMLFLHKRRFILGRDLIAYIERHGVTEPPTRGAAKRTTWRPMTRTRGHRPGPPGAGY